MENLITRINQWLQDYPEITAAWLGGSYGRGDADAFSDVDAVAFVETPEEAESVFMQLQDSLRQQPDIVFLKTIPLARVINCITQSWQRFDIAIIDPSGLARYGRDEISILFDRASVVARLPEFAPVVSFSTTELVRLVEEFIRVLGLLTVVMGRDDYVAAQNGAQLLRDCLIRIIKMDYPPLSTRGVNSLKKTLSPEDYQLITGTPPLSATREAVLDAHRYLAESFLPLARRLYQYHGLAWPERFLEATLAHVEAKLGLKVRINF